MGVQIPHSPGLYIMKKLLKCNHKHECEYGECFHAKPHEWGEDCNGTWCETGRFDDCECIPISRAKVVAVKYIEFIQKEEFMIW